MKLQTARKINWEMKNEAKKNFPDKEFSCDLCSSG